MKIIPSGARLKLLCNGIYPAQYHHVGYSYDSGNRPSKNKLWAWFRRDMMEGIESILKDIHKNPKLRGHCVTITIRPYCRKSKPGYEHLDYKLEVGISKTVHAMNDWEVK